jgi:hypothetical protein
MCWILSKTDQKEFDTSPKWIRARFDLAAKTPRLQKTVHWIPKGCFNINSLINNKSPAEVIAVMKKLDIEASAACFKANGYIKTIKLHKLVRYESSHLSCASDGYVMTWLRDETAAEFNKRITDKVLDEFYKTLNKRRDATAKAKKIAKLQAELAKLK